MNEDDYHSRPLVVGSVTFAPKPVFVPRSQPLFPLDWTALVGPSFYDKHCPVSKHRVDVDEMNQDYGTYVVHVDKRTHRIRYEGETAHEVTVIIEPK